MISAPVISAENLRRGPEHPYDSDWVFDLIHDLRQPLSAIEAIAYHLQMRSGEDQEDLRQFAVRLQQLVEDANSTMSAALTR